MEADFNHLSSISDILPCFNELKNTKPHELMPEEIRKCDEALVKPVGQAFIKLYHHFTYVSPGVVNCKIPNGEESYQRHEMKQEGLFPLLFDSTNFDYYLGS